MSGFVVRVPATSANLGPGFDCLGLAMDLYNEVHVAPAESPSWQIDGEGVEELAATPNSMFYRSLKHLFEMAGKELPILAIRQSNKIPLARGLGSSSAAIVAGLMAANRLLGNPFSPEVLLDEANRIEGHPDNVAAALLGGLTVAWTQGRSARAISLPFPEDLRMVLGVPDIKISTAEARKVLPAKLPLQDAVFSISRVSLLLASLLSGRLEALADACQDKIHTPYRSKLIPGFNEVVKAAREGGAHGVVISGSGPTILAFAPSNAAEGVSARMRTAFAAANVTARSLICRAVTGPPRVL
ncbi:MAG: homoserine kinase [Candidatus Xenobia bacterium]